MAGVLLSSSEEIFIVNGVQENYRSDGRSNIDYRPMELETDVVSHATGSARLRLANTDILVGVKTEIDAPVPNKPNEGKIEFFVDCSANATPEFEGRGGEQLGTSISNMMLKAYSSSQAFDLKQLCILEEKHCWKLYIDILILECGGNLFDAVSLAVKAALFNTRIPLVKAVVMDGGSVDLQLSDDPFDYKLLKVGKAPLLVTLCRVGSYCVVDPSAEEESCSPISIVFGITGNEKHYMPSKEAENLPMVEGKCSMIAMNGYGSINSVTFKDALILANSAMKSLDDTLGRALLRERQQNITMKKFSYGFLK